LDEEDREVLKQAQLAWIKFRDMENKLIGTLYMPNYTGGGTMYWISVAYESMEITKKRVLEIYAHISRFYEFAY
jgi:uncharacterized protein YecT (DUF1311 family)